MYSSPASRTALARVAICAGLAALLAACNGHAPGAIDDVYEPSLHYQMHPIEVTKGTVQLKLPSHSAKLSAAHRDAVQRFAKQARDHEVDRVVIQRPDGRVSADVVAGHVTQIMREQGVAATSMSHATYKGSGPVVVSFSRHFAMTQQCGDWTEDLASDHFHNLPYPNFGCAQQHNIAAMVAKPKDLETPRTTTPADATRRAQVIEDYRTPKSPATPAQPAETAVVSEVAE